MNKKNYSSIDLKIKNSEDFNHIFAFILKQKFTTEIFRSWLTDQYFKMINAALDMFDLSLKNSQFADYEPMQYNQISGL